MSCKQRWSITPVGIAVVCLILVGTLTVSCNSSHSQTAHVTITGAGSTFINPAMTQWIEAFRSSHPGVQITYQPVGSGSGIEQLKQGQVDFAASDAALDDEKLKGMPALVQIPESGGPVCIAYNLPELKSPLRLSGATLAGIFLGQIKWWQDPLIQMDNQGVRVPNHAIAVVHRSDGSGTTNIFTTYLAHVSHDWSTNIGHGISVNWPVGAGGKGSEAVASAIQKTPGSIGYVELSYAKAHKLPVAQIKNQAGAWVEPTALGATAAIDAFQWDLEKDVRMPVVDPPASAGVAYPISGLTYLLVPKQIKDIEKQQAVKAFVQYIVTEGQASSQELQYATLPLNLAGEDQKLLGQIQDGGQQASSNQPGR
jgi:phosphate transport system substrate-binding protein